MWCNVVMKLHKLGSICWLAYPFNSVVNASYKSTQSTLLHACMYPSDTCNHSVLSPDVATCCSGTSIASQRVPGRREIPG